MLVVVDELRVTNVSEMKSPTHQNCPVKYVAIIAFISFLLFEEYCFEYFKQYLDMERQLSGELRGHHLESCFRQEFTK